MFNNYLLKQYHVIHCKVQTHKQTKHSTIIVRQYLLKAHVFMYLFVIYMFAHQCVCMRVYAGVLSVSP